MQQRETFYSAMAVTDESLANTHQLLKNTIPFNSLSESILKDIAAMMKWKKFSPGEMIIKQGSKGENFYIISSGLVRVFLLNDEGKEALLGFMGESDCFGEISLITGGFTTANVQAMENTTALIQSKDKFISMIHEHPIFYSYFNQLQIVRMRFYEELLSKTPGTVQIEPFLYRKQVKDITSTVESFCLDVSTVEEVTQKIIEKGLHIVVVIDGQKKPSGILRPHGILQSVVLQGTKLHDSVEKITEKDFYCIDTESYFFDALHMMIKHKTNELIVLNKGKFAGILTGYDLLRFRSRGVLSLMKNIEDASDISQLNHLRGEVEKVLRSLMADGALASHACKIVSEFNDKMVRRVISLSEEKFGPPPSPYAWLGLGSEGRKEQTLLTDQDNALIFSGLDSEHTHEYFKRFSTTVVEGLNECGFPLCKGGIMASNPRFWGHMEQWKIKTTEWIRSLSPSDNDLIDIHVFLDFRSVKGDQSLETELRSHIIGMIKKYPSFLRSIAQTVVSWPMPIGFFKNFIVEKSGKHKNSLNLKLHGLVPLISCVKILALEQGLHETNTLERIDALNKGHIISDDQAEMLKHAFETFLTLRIRDNLNDIEQGRELSNHINPSELSIRQKQLLKEAFWSVTELQNKTKEVLRIAGAGV